MTCYEFSGQKVEMENFSPPTYGRSLKLGISLQVFDRHCLHGRFTFEMNFVYAEDKRPPIRTVKYRSDVSKYAIHFHYQQCYICLLQVPYFELSTPLTFMRLDQYHVSAAMASLFNAKFKMDSVTSLSARDLLCEME